MTGESRRNVPGDPIESYAAIGDGRTIALVGRKGQVDWLPIPDLQATPIFARILDHEHGGTIELEPQTEYSVERRYIPGTNVLETTFTTPDGIARLTDALVVGVAGRLPWAQLGRRIEGISGYVEFAWRVHPGTMLGTVSPWIEETDRGEVIRCGDTTVGVVGVRHNPDELDATTTDIRLSGRFTTGNGSRHIIGVVGATDEPLRLPDPQEVDRGIDRTIESWKFWSREFSYDGPWDEAVHRSALALKLLVYSPTGAIVAAATPALPETKDGHKNWDYRFAWIRDLAYTVNSLIRFGLREETHAALSWLMKAVRAKGVDLDVFYDLDGGISTETMERRVPGWRGIGPVVEGNPAHDQLQLGVYADVLSICRAYVDSGAVLDKSTSEFLYRLAERVCDIWRYPDAGMWELGDDEHYVSSKMGCWQALRDAIHLADKGEIPGNVERWVVELEKVRHWVETEGWSEDLKSYVMIPGTDQLDASVLLHAISGFDRGERMASTIDVLTSRLGADDLIYRYTGMDQEENTFVACAFWKASALAHVGRIEEATELMDRLVDRANDVGIYSEMINADDGSFWGNTVQALSHLALIDTAFTIHHTTREK